ncbi:hypothetical protein GCM10010218_31690 [Streptomyces mashuensis]|uniref:Uncharacterized protein n=1 Tax=Streptomyces mashuensis TaxID=33904 RepID=A0A919EC98_9ACTN|nr:hypothetical protein [Streptomyces mashuensis]GHF47914.1 hypothetical protein GCM10010218_31690 [Streptomyces mashuensis]
MTDTGKEQGGISIGSLTGGAVSQGDGSHAEDRSERIGSEPAGAAHGPVPQAADGGIAVHTMAGGAVAQGDRAAAVDASRRLLAVPDELLDAIGLLRREMADRPRAHGDGIDEVDGELADLQEEVRRTGRARRGRLARLRTLLNSGATAAGGLASAVAVVDGISQLLS